MLEDETSRPRAGQQLGGYYCSDEASHKHEEIGMSLNPNFENIRATERKLAQVDPNKRRRIGVLKECSGDSCYVLFPVRAFKKYCTRCGEEQAKREAKKESRSLSGRRIQN